MDAVDKLIHAIRYDLYLACMRGRLAYFRHDYACAHAIECQVPRLGGWRKMNSAELDTHAPILIFWKSG